MTYYPFYASSSWIGVCNLMRWMLSTSQDYLSYPWVIDFPIMWSTYIL